MYESINIDRARAAGLSILDVPRSQLTPFSRHRPSQTAVWVNGLWFTSLALSLTTALMAVLTKQWIHQYMSVPSGTPRDRSRIRQFRYMSLQRWQVPVIIGLLPVLMHIALGVFFAGLIVYLYSLNTAMSGVVTGIASTAFIVYFLTNLLPLYKPDCPYKTPLTIHSYAFLISVWERVRTLTKAGESFPSKEHLSLKAVEKETVTREADVIDAHSVAWLHDVSSNSSVQRIVLQALSNLPLGTVETVREAIPELEPSIRRCLYEYGTAERRYGYERLTRAYMRFNKNPMFSPSPFQEAPVENSLLSLIYSTESDNAVQFLSQQILEPTVKLDSISWLWVFRNALLRRIDWLEIEVDDSPIWSSFLSLFLRPHRCSSTSHHRKPIASITLDCHGDLFDVGALHKYSGFQLVLHESDGCPSEKKSSNDGIDLESAVADFMYPSLCEFLLSIMLFDPCVVIADQALPSDIRLHLALLQTPHIQTATIPTVEGQPPLRRLIEFINAFVDIDCDVRRETQFGGPIVHHDLLPGAVFDSIHAIITKSDAFESRISPRDQRDLLHAAFRCLVLDKDLREKQQHWLSDVSLLEKIVGLVFHRPHIFFLPFIAEILDYSFLSRSIIGVEMYRGLLQGTWFDFLRHEFMVSTDDEDAHALPLNERGYGAADHAHSFIVVSYIDGLEILEELAPDLYQQTLEDIRTPSNLFILSQVLILADVDSRNRLWKLAKLVGRDKWQICMTRLAEFLHTDAANAFYQEQSSYFGCKHPYHEHVQLTFSPFEQLSGLVDQFSLVWQWERGNFPFMTPIYNAPKQLEVGHSHSYIHVSS